MTVLLAAKEGNELVLGSDRKVSLYWHLSGEAYKQFKKRGFVFGGTGTGRDIQLIEYKLAVPAWNEDHTEESFMFEVAEAMRTLLMAYGDKYKTSMEASFLVLGREKIHLIASDYSVVTSESVIADGCGCDIVLGAYTALSSVKGLSVEDKVRRSIAVTNSISNFCGRGVDIQKITIPDKP